MLAAIATWTLSFTGPSVGLDPSWMGSLYMAAHRGLHFGSQIVFTYGPLGFLAWAGQLWYGELAVIGFLFQAVLHVLLCVSLVWALRRSVNPLIALILTVFLVIAGGALDISITLAAICCLAALAPEPPGFATSLVVFGGAVLGAIETLIELRLGLVILGMCAITLVALERRRRNLSIFIALSVLVFALLWFASGQGFDNLSDFASNSLQIVSGYSEAMTVPPASAIYLPAMILISVGLVAAGALTSAPGRPRPVAALMVAFVSFSIFKEGIVRGDSGHAVIFFGTALGLAAGLAFGRRRLMAVAAVTALGAVAITAAQPGLQLAEFNPITRAGDAINQFRNLLSPSRRAVIKFAGAVSMNHTYGLQPATLRLLKGQSVDIDPSEAAIAWTYGLKWDPLPVFQNYSAYTSALDRLNSNALRSSQGPRRILRGDPRIAALRVVPSIDGRFAPWDPPEQAIAMLCNYVSLQTTANWQVLGKVPDRCGPPRLIDSIHTQYGQTVRIPPADTGTLLFARISGAAVSGLERFQSFLYHAGLRYIVVNGWARFRLIPGTAADGLIMDASPRVDYPVPFALRPAARTIKLTGSSGPLRIDLYQMPVHKTSVSAVVASPAAATTETQNK